MNYPKNKNQPVQWEPNCPSCKRKNWLEFDKSYYRRKCEYITDR